MNRAPFRTALAFLLACLGHRAAGSSNADVPLQVGRDVPRPKWVSGSAPAYPDIARAAGVEGMIVLKLVVNGEGRPIDIGILRGTPLIAEAAIDAVKGWRYEPTLIDGVARPVEFIEPVPFFLDERSLANAYARLAGDRNEPAYLRVRMVTRLAELSEKRRKDVAKTLEKLAKEPDASVAEAAADALARLRPPSR